MMRCLAAVTAFILGALPPLAGAATQLSMNPGSVVEGDLGDTHLDFFVTRSGDLTQPVNVGLFTLQTGLAQAGVDYEELAFGNRVVFLAGVASAAFRVIVHGDRAPEFNETFTVALVSPYEEDGAARTLAPAVEFPAPLPTGASDHTLADIDGDHRPDVLIAAGGQAIVILRNTTVGEAVSFATPLTFDLGADVAGIAAADFDGDGLADIAVSRVNSDQVSVVRNQSTPGSIVLGTSVPLALAVGDYDDDGSLDLVAANHGDSTVSVYVNTSTPGSISFDPTVTGPGGSFPVDLAVADLDGDGLPELVTAHQNGQVFVRRNLCCADPPYDSAQLVFTGATAVVTGDVDGDGPADVVLNGSGEARLLRNTSTPGAVSFAPMQGIPAGGDLVDVALADLDGDGLPEIAGANSSDGVVVVLPNDSTPGSPAFLAAEPHTMGADPSRLVAGDLNGDGFPEPLSLNPADASLGLLRNQGTDVALDLSQFEAYIFNDDAFPVSSSALTPLALLGMLALLLLRRRVS